MNVFVMPFIGLCLLLWLGHWLRLNISFLRILYLPSSVIGGLVGLILIESLKAAGIHIPSEWTQGWSSLPGFLINIVFACLFIGVSLPGISTIWKRSAPQLAYGQTVAWGQYLVGIGLFAVLIHPFWSDIPAMFGAILPVGFEGGHGTAGGLAPTFTKLGWNDGKDFALASATVGIMSAVIVGIILINWAVARGHTHKEMSTGDVLEDDTVGVIPVDKRPIAGKLSVKSDSIEAMSLHLSIVGIAVLIGVILKEMLLMTEHCVKPLLDKDGLANYHILIKSFPLFPLCMIGGLIIQLFEDRYDRYKIIDLGLTRRIQNMALDFLIVAAISTIKIETLQKGIVPFIIIMIAGIGWNVFCVMVLARRYLPDAWFERAIAEMGQSMGVTATGLLLLRVVDPEYESPAVDAFAYKQLMHEPFMGGGLWTSTAIPLLGLGIAWMPAFVFGLSVFMIVFWAVVAYILKKRSV